MTVMVKSNGLQKPYVSMCARRFHLVPLALVMLTVLSALSITLRIRVLSIEPSVDMTPYYEICKEANKLASLISSRTDKRIPEYDLTALEPEVNPAAAGLPSLAIPQGPNIPIEPAAAPPPPLPSLEGIIYSETETSLAVLNDRSAAEGDIVEEWRILEIAPERVLLIHDASGTRKEVVLYEKKNKEQPE